MPSTSLPSVLGTFPPCCKLLLSLASQSMSPFDGYFSYHHLYQTLSRHPVPLYCASQPYACGRLDSLSLVPIPFSQPNITERTPSLCASKTITNADFCLVTHNCLGFQDRTSGNCIIHQCWSGKIIAPIFFNSFWTVHIILEVLRTIPIDNL